MPNILRWVHFDMDERELRNRVKNKMIRPTTIPQSLEALVFEQAVAREALRLAYEQHKEFATTLKGVQQQRTVGDTFSQQASGQTIVDKMKLDLLVGSGGVLSHAPRMHQTAMLLIDAFQPEGFTTLAKDSIFMMPHLGVLAQVHPQAAHGGLRARLPDLPRHVRRRRRARASRASRASATRSRAEPLDESGEIDVRRDQAAAARARRDGDGGGRAGAGLRPRRRARQARRARRSRAAPSG